MNIVSIIFSIQLILLLILVGWVISARRRVWVKIVPLALLVLVAVTNYVAYSELLSRPKPVEAEWLRSDLAEATVLGSSMQEGKAIYLWLSLEGVKEPRGYSLPWDEKLARQLQGARRSAKASGTQVKMRNPFEQSMDRRDRLFYAASQPPLPEKQRPVDNALQFKGSRSRGPNQ